VRLVISHLEFFASFGGTETYILTVAQQLERLGHEVTIYTSDTGPMTEFARRQGVRVSDGPAGLPASCDAVLAQDASTAWELAGRYPSAVRTFTMHTAHNPLQSPPQSEGISHALVVLNDRMLRRARRLSWRPRIVRLRQPIDLKRFSIPSPSARGRRRPRALALSNHINPARLGMLEAACSDAGLELTRLGGADGTSSTPEHAIAGVEIVVSLGRGALEAMAGGRSVYLWGPAGGDGWVNPAAYETLESDGFSGRATEATSDAARLAAELSEWQDGMGEPNRDLVWAHHDGERHAVALVELIEELDATPGHAADHFEELARLVRLEWYSFGRAEGALAENRQLRAELDATRIRADALEEQARLATAAALAVRDSRRYRIGSRLALPFDRLRGR
jgi:hypothetical protein